MEDGLVLYSIDYIVSTILSLNPCCNGRWSRTDFKATTESLKKVLILVVMEDGLVLDLIRLF